MIGQASPVQESVSLSKTERHEYIVGIAVAVVLALILTVTALANRGAAKIAAEGFTLTAAFRRADGVHIGSPVRVAGVKIGTVSAATLGGNQQAVLTLRLNAPLELPSDTAAVVETDGLFGTKYIELRPGGEEEILKSGARMNYTQDSVILEDLIGLVIQRAKDARATAPTSQQAP